ncbi:hypothetical protein [Rosenbergiella metrosideri]|uniref:TreTu family toxin n=1 Tax=Rosenbergiella metrosideri TaxID=2921185 RepID=UPI003BABBF7E
MKQLAASSDCVGQCRELANYSISQLEPVANNTQLHKDNLTKAVLASTILALTLDQPAKSGEKTPAAGASSASKPASAIDDIVNGTGGAVGIGNTTAEETAIKNADKVNINSSLKVGETKVVNNISVTRVGRWMSSDELAQMQSSGKVVQGGGGQTFISTNGVNDFKGAAPKGSVYVEFDVPSSSLIQGGKDGWYKMLGSDAKPSQKYQLDKQGGSLTPDVNNINVLDKK